MSTHTNGSTHSSKNHSKGNQSRVRHPLEIDQFVDRFLATMCDSTRRHILELLTIPNGEETTSILERRSGDIAKELGLTPATISGHLRQLSEAGLVSARREGNEVYYRVRNHMLVRAFHDLLLALDKEHASRFSGESA